VSISGEAFVDTDGLIIRLPFQACGAGPAQTQEEPDRVLLTLYATPVRAPAACGYPEVDVRLGRPLWGRVLIDTTNHRTVPFFDGRRLLLPPRTHTTPALKLIVSAACQYPPPGVPCWVRTYGRPNPPEGLPTWPEPSLTISQSQTVSPLTTDPGISVRGRPASLYVEKENMSIDDVPTRRILTWHVAGMTVVLDADARLIPTTAALLHLANSLRPVA